MGRTKTALGKWYVSYYGASTKTAQDIMRNLRRAIIGGPFATKDDAQAWLEVMPARDHAMSMIWQERLDS